MTLLYFGIIAQLAGTLIIIYLLINFKKKHMEQLNLRFDNFIIPGGSEIKPHTKENNSFSEKFLVANIDKIKGNNLKVYNLLKSGKRLTVNGAVKDYDISSLPRRIKDIEVALDIEISRDVIGNSRFVEYYL